MEWVYVVSSSKTDGGHCVHDVLFLTVIRLMEIKGVSVQVKFTHAKSEHDQLHAARNWLPLLGKSLTERTLSYYCLITVIDHYPLFLYNMFFNSVVETLHDRFCNQD
mgnify:CR=1 FL=1